VTDSCEHDKEPSSSLIGEEGLNTSRLLNFKRLRDIAHTELIQMWLCLYLVLLNIWVR